MWLYLLLYFITVSFSFLYNFITLPPLILYCFNILL